MEWRFPIRQIDSSCLLDSRLHGNDELAGAPLRHSGVGRNPDMPQVQRILRIHQARWIPAHAGMSKSELGPINHYWRNHEQNRLFLLVAPLIFLPEGKRVALTERCTVGGKRLLQEPLLGI